MRRAARNVVQKTRAGAEQARRGKSPMPQPQRPAHRPPWALAVLAAVTAAACGAPPALPPAHRPRPTATATAPAPPPASPVGTAAISVGGRVEPVLITAAGRTLYYFTADTPTAVACTGSCLTLWPPLLTTATSLLAPSGVPGALTVLRGANGAQVEYQGHPLYTYAGDTGPGQANGEGQLGQWFVATPGLAPPPSPSPSPSPSGGGSAY